MPDVLPAPCLAFNILSPYFLSLISKYHFETGISSRIRNVALHIPYVLHVYNHIQFSRYTRQLTLTDRIFLSVLDKSSFGLISPKST